MGTSVTSEPLTLPTLVATEMVVSTEVVELVFDGVRAYEDVKFQVDLGPWIPGTEGHAAVIDWMVAELESAGWVATMQEGEYLGVPIWNVVAKRVDTVPGAAGGSFSGAFRYPDPAVGS